MKKTSGKVSQGALMTALICGIVSLGGAHAFAAVMTDEELKAFTLDPMIVTAQKVEKRDLNTPASVEVISQEKIEQSGAANAFDALSYGIGISTHAQGPNGMSMGSMTSRIHIRGVEKGTLILVNGVALNQDGKYNLDDIPAELIEKIEIVRGGGSVLYGSEATGGVINIITKKNLKHNSVRAEAGNYGREKYSVSIGAGKFNAVAHYANRGKINKYAAADDGTHYDYLDGDQKGINWNYQLNDALTFTHSYAKNDHRILLAKKKEQINHYQDTDNSFLLRYDKDGLSSYLSYGTQEKQYDKNNALNSWRKGHNLNFDLQKRTAFGKNSFIIGSDYKREDMDLKVGSTRFLNQKRNIYSVYASYDWAVSDKSNLIFNARETWVRNVIGENTTLKTGKTLRNDNPSQKKFTPEVQFIHKLTEQSSIYAKAGKSFRLPNLTNIFGSNAMNPVLDLKPEQGTHYEIGYKQDFNKSALRAALFKYNLKDAIIYKSGSPIIGDVVYTNSDIRNMGVEASYTMNHNNNFSSNLGLYYAKPETRGTTYGDTKWHNIYNRYQITGGVNYHTEKFSAALNANFMGNRTANDAEQGKLKPQMFTNLHMEYKPEKNHKIYFNLNNIFDREDIINSGTSKAGSTIFYSLGRNFTIGYEYTF